MSAVVCVYYNVIVAWTFYYLFMSFKKTLPWSSCNNEWNDESCVNIRLADSVITNGNYIPTINGSNITFETASEQFWK